MEQNNQNGTPFEGDKIQEVQVLTLTRVEAMVQIAEKSFEQVFIEKGGEEKQKELVKKMKKVMALPKEETVTTLEEAKKVKREFAKVRTALEDVRKEIKRDIIDSGKAVDEVSDRFKVKFTVHEDKLGTFITELETLQEEKKLAEEKRIDGLKKNRIAELESNGCVFQGQWWAINDISLGTQQIQEMPEESWVDLIAKVKVQNELNIKAKKEKEEADAAESKRLDDLRIANEAAAAALKKQQDDFAAQQAAFAKQQADFAAAQQKAEEEKKQAEQAEENKRIQAEKDEKEKQERETLAVNAKPFEELGYKHNYSTGDWEITVGIHSHPISKADMLELREGFYDEIKSMVDGWKKEWVKLQEQIRLDDVFASRRVELINLGFSIAPSGAFKIDYNDAESESVIPSVVRTETDEQFNAYITSVKAKIEKENEKKRQAQLDDVAKFNEWVSKLRAIELPVVTDNEISMAIGSVLLLLVKK